MRVGVIGVGRKGETHLQALALAGVEIAAVQDLSEGRAHEMAQKYGVPRVARDFRELIALDEVDAVAIVTPPGSMLEIVTAACERGKHLICEKPLGCDSREARAMLEIATRAGVQHALCHQLRYDPSHRYIRELVREGFIGTPLLVSVEMLFDFGLNSGVGGWIRDPRAGGGALIQMFSHVMDCLRFTFGNWSVKYIDAGPAPAMSGLIPGECDDIVTIIGKLPGGGRISLDGGWVLRHPRKGMWQVYGTEGTLVLGDDMRVFGGRAGEDFRDLGLPARHLPIVGGDRFPAPDKRDGPIGWSDGLETLASLVREFEQKVAGSTEPTHYATFEDGVWLHENNEAGRKAAA